ncbi:GNAT family N-acetyltransferase [Candidatus Bathyarchaeota archaeon]|nr:GNAT family N-acetyltransferase [Candidatus Bathyarchaeota archaeon]
MKDYTFAKPESDGEFEALFKMMDAVFGEEDVRSITRRFVEHHPVMNKEHFFMVKKGEKVVAGLLLIPQVWKLGDVELKVAEMGCVGTDPEHRRINLQRVLNNEFDEYAKQHGFDLCALAGIPFFYRQFGYQYAVQLNYSTEIPLDKIPEKETEFRIGDFTDDHIDKADIILRKSQERYLVHSVRSQEIWEMQQKTCTYGADPFQTAGLFHENGFVGYYRYSVDQEKKSIKIKELALDEKISPEDLAGVIVKHASLLGLTTVNTGLSHQDEFSKFLISLGAKTNRPYAWQVKILDLTKFLAQISPVLELRIKNSEFKGVSKELVMNFWKFAIKMEFQDGKMTDIEKVYGEEDRTIGWNPYAFIQLALGYKDRKELEEMYPDFRVRGDVGGLIDVMFPKQPGYIHYCY